MTSSFSFWLQASMPSRMKRIPSAGLGTNFNACTISLLTESDGGNETLRDQAAEGFRMREEGRYLL